MVQVHPVLPRPPSSSFGLGHCPEILYMKEWDKEFIIFVWCVLGIVYTSLILSVIYVYVKVGVL